MTFTAGPGLIEPVVGDPSREAIASLRGYAYQLYLSTLAWMGLAQGEVLHLEVAEDYAIATQAALEAVQVKDAAASGSLTLRHKDVIQAIDNFVHLHTHNPGRRITLRFLSTAEIGKERAVKDRPDGAEGLVYWRRAAAGEKVTPLRTVLEALPLKTETLRFIRTRDDAALRKDLLQRLHWDGSRPDFATVREEFDLAMTALGQHHHLTVNESRQLGGTLLMTVLDVIVTPGSRRLTTVDLTERLEAATHIAVPRRHLETLIQQTQGGLGAPATRTTLMSETGAPFPKLLARRVLLVDQIIQRLEADGAVVLTGGTGSGKTLLARLVSRRRAGDWRIVDLYGLGRQELVARLDAVLAASALEAFDGLILDDLNGHEDPDVERALARLAEALRRRDRPLLISSYQAPAARLRDALCIEPESSIAVSRLTVRETADLIVDADGDPDRWARAIHSASGPGHPQLVQAMIADFRRRGWPTEEASKLERLELGDLMLVEEREAARRRLVQAASPDARKLLDRLSVVLGTFKRPLALELARLPPPAHDAGACLDDLTGPWIDRLSSDRFRLSPLLNGLAAANMTETEVTVVRRQIAKALVGGKNLDVQDVGEAFVQALASSAEEELTRIGLAVLSTDINQLGDLAMWLIPLRALRTDQPIYPANPTISRILRLAQVLLESEAESSRGFAEAWQALQAELVAEPDEAVRESFEAMAFAKVLLCRKFSQAVDDWLNYLVRFDQLTRTNETFSGLVANYKRGVSGRGSDPVGFLFHYQALSLPSVDALLKCFEDLDRLDGGVRERLLADFDAKKGDAAVVLSHAWVADRDNDRLDGATAAESYRRIAEIAAGWQKGDLATRALIARAVMFDEYVDDRPEAVGTLDEAETRFGAQVAIDRARATIFFRRKEYSAALHLIEALADNLGGEVVERAYVFRQAGISASELSRWSDARKWFEAARDEAAQAHTTAMEAMAAGLLGDIAIASRRDGDDVDAVQHMARALEALSTIDPEGSLKGAYVHRALGHAVLWLNGELTETQYEVEGDSGPPQAPAGFCSNPDPMEGIRERPLTDRAGAWYLLALADIAIDGAAGEAVRLPARLGGKIITGMETSVRRAELDRGLRSWDVERFPDLFEAYAEAHLWLRDKAAIESDVALTVVDGPFPKPSTEQKAKSETASLVANLLIRIAITGGMRKRPDTLEQLRRVGDRFNATGYPGVELIDEALAASESDLAKALAAWLILADEAPVAPREIWAAGFYLLNMKDVSELFGGRFADAVDEWVRTSWDFVIGRQRFLLASPPLAEERIKTALASAQRGYGLLAKVLQEMHRQVGLELSSEVIAYLRNA
ncbi:MAG: hypothetical protein JWP35_1632 [Caulobacter sp.]|nr:hypothetical protein [Caulobacter sp.]